MRIGVFAGSFDPVTCGHMDIINKAAALFDELHVITAVNPQKEYMFSEEIRLEMLKAAASESEVSGCRIICSSWSGAVFEYCKKAGASFIVKGLRSAEDFFYEKTLALQTRALCPSVITVFIPASPELEHISSSFVREMIKGRFDLTGVMPEGAVRYVNHRS